MSSDIIETIAELSAKHKLVPFLGAGCSYNHTKLNWELICKEMALEMSFSSDGLSPLEIAQEYVNKSSKVELCNFLKKHLEKEFFLDTDGEVLLAIMSLNLGTLYTTNQDNIFELCTKKYGRDYKPVVQLDDLALLQPGDNVYVKYHGHLDSPETVIFCSKDYQDRIANSEHFLNIKLKADLLAKSFLFIGYSFRDPNIEEIFSTLNNIFKGKLPASYLVAWDYDPELELLGNKFGITIIDPSILFPDSQNKAEAFELFFTKLSEKTYFKKTSEQLSNMFESKKPYSQRILTKYDIKALEGITEKSNCLEAIDTFRGLVDQSLVPEDHSKAVLAVFEKLCQNARLDDEAQALQGALHNLKLRKPYDMLVALSLVMTCANSLPVKKLGSMFMPILFDIPQEEFRHIAVAHSVEKLSDWGHPMTESFRSYVADWVDDSSYFDEANKTSTSEYFNAMIDLAWTTNSTVHEHPAKRYARLKGLGFKKHRFAPSAKKISEDMLNMFPKKFKKPFEE